MLMGVVGTVRLYNTINSVCQSTYLLNGRTQKASMARDVNYPIG